MKRPSLTVSRVLTGVLGVQLAIAVFLIVGDMQSGGFRLPSLGPSAPRLDAPVRPGDQRRVFSPQRDHPNVRPLRDPGTLPDRLALSQDSDGIWRLEGAIAPGDAGRIIDQLEGKEITTLRLQSPGGSVQDALELGRALRARTIETVMLDGEYCYSACPYLLAGGSTRTLARDAYVGVHQHYFGENTLLPAFVAVEDIQRGQGEVMAYLVAMGIDPRVMMHALTTPSDQIYILLPEELKEYGFVDEG